MVSPVADFVVDMGSDGRILSQGSLTNALAHDAKLLKELQQEQEETTLPEARSRRTERCGEDEASLRS